MTVWTWPLMGEEGRYVVSLLRRLGYRAQLKSSRPGTCTPAPSSTRRRARRAASSVGSASSTDRSNQHVEVWLLRQSGALLRPRDRPESRSSTESVRDRPGERGQDVGATRPRARRPGALGAAVQPTLAMACVEACGQLAVPPVPGRPARPALGELVGRGGRGCRASPCSQPSDARTLSGRPPFDYAALFGPDPRGRHGLNPAPNALDRGGLRVSSFVLRDQPRERGGRSGLRKSAQRLLESAPRRGLHASCPRARGTIRPIALWPRTHERSAEDDPRVGRSPRG